MNQAALYQAFENKYEKLKAALAGNQNVLVPRAVFFSERSSVFRCLRVHLITEGFRRKGLLCGRFTGSAC